MTGILVPEMERTSEVASILRLRNDPAFMAVIRRSLQSRKNGNLISWNEAKATLIRG